MEDSRLREAGLAALGATEAAVETVRDRAEDLAKVAEVARERAAETMDTLARRGERVVGRARVTATRARTRAASTAKGLRSRAKSATGRRRAGAEKSAAKARGRVKSARKKAAS